MKILLKTLIIVFNDDYYYDRRLNEKSIKITLSGKYLLNIYKIDNSTSYIIYYSYAILLNLKIIKVEKIIKLKVLILEILMKIFYLLIFLLIQMETLMN